MHTPTPWSNTSGQDTIWANDGDLLVAKIADLPWKDGKSQWMQENANAAFIVRACNSHAELLEACKELLPLIQQHHRGETPSINIDDITRREQLISRLKTAVSCYIESPGKRP